MKTHSAKRVRIFHINIPEEIMESKKRSAVKTVTYRAVALVATIPITGVSSAVKLHVVLMIIYYIHERIWGKINWH